MNQQDLKANYTAPDTKYFKTKVDFDKAVSKDFVFHANNKYIVFCLCINGMLDN